MVIYALWKRKCGLCQIVGTNRTPNKLRKKRKNVNKGSIDKNIEEKSNNIEALINGEFNAVLALLRILPQGKQAKKWCDEVIDVLSHMQNLRTAIYSMQMRGEK